MRALLHTQTPLALLALGALFAAVPLGIARQATASAAAAPCPSCRADSQATSTAAK